MSDLTAKTSESPTEIASAHSLPPPDEQPLDLSASSEVTFKLVEQASSGWVDKDATRPPPSYDDWKRGLPAPKPASEGQGTDTTAEQEDELEELHIPDQQMAQLEVLLQQPLSPTIHEVRQGTAQSLFLSTPKRDAEEEHLAVAAGADMPRFPADDFDIDWLYEGEPRKTKKPVQADPWRQPIAPSASLSSPGDAEPEERGRPRVKSTTWWPEGRKTSRQPDEPTRSRKREPRSDEVRQEMSKQMREAPLVSIQQGATEQRDFHVGPSPTRPPEHPKLESHRPQRAKAVVHHYQSGTSRSQRSKRPRYPSSRHLPTDSYSHRAEDGSRIMQEGQAAHRAAPTSYKRPAIMAHGREPVHVYPNPIPPRRQGYYGEGTPPGIAGRMDQSHGGRGWSYDASHVLSQLAGNPRSNTAYGPAFLGPPLPRQEGPLEQGPRWQRGLPGQERFPGQHLRGVRTSQQYNYEGFQERGEDPQEYMDEPFGFTQMYPPEATRHANLAPSYGWPHRDMLPQDPREGWGTCEDGQQCKKSSYRATRIKKIKEDSITESSSSSDDEERGSSRKRKSESRKPRGYKDYSPREMKRLERSMQRSFISRPIVTEEDGSTSETSSEDDRSSFKHHSYRSGRHHSRSPRRKAMDPPIYNGSESFLDYCLQFELIAEDNNWNAEEMGRRLAGSLRGSATIVLGLLGKRRARSYRSLVKALMKRFHPTGMETRYAIELMSKRFNKKKEDLPKFGQDLQILAKKAYPGSTISERQMCDHFVRGLPKEMRKQVQLMRPSTMDKALVAALTIQAVEEESEDNKPKKPKAEIVSAIQKTHKKKNGRKPRKQMDEANSGGNDSIVAVATEDSPVMKILDNLTNLMDKLNVRTTEQSQRIEGLEKRLQRKPRSEVICHGCGTKGHYKNECTQSSAPRSSNPYRPQQTMAMVEEDWAGENQGN